MKCKANSAAYVNRTMPLESDDCAAILYVDLGRNQTAQHFLFLTVAIYAA